MYLNNFENIMILWNHVCSPYPMNMLYVWVASFFQCVSLFELNAWEDKWFVVIKALQKGKMKEKKIQKTEKWRRNDLVCEQHIDACKVATNWDGQDFKNHAN